MSNGNNVLRTLREVAIPDNGGSNVEGYYHRVDEYFNDDGCGILPDSEVGIEDKEKRRGQNLSKPVGEKMKLKRLTGAEYDVKKASKYFKSDDFRILDENVLVNDLPRIYEDGQRPADVDEFSDKEESVGQCDSDASTYSGENINGSLHSQLRKGSYDFVSADDGFEYGGVNGGLRIDAEGDSDFDNYSECSSFSVSDSENDSLIDEDEENPYSGANSKHKNDYSDTGQLSNDEVGTSDILKGQIRGDNVLHNHQDSQKDSNARSVNTEMSNQNKIHRTVSYERACSHEGSLSEVSDDYHFQEDYIDYGSDEDSFGYGEDVEYVDSEDNDGSDPHSLIRKPAVRRRGFAWVSKSLPGNTRSGWVRLKYRQQDPDLSSELAPSHLNLHDRRIASASRDDMDEENMHVSAEKKTQSLPATTSEDTLDELHHHSIRMSPQRMQDKSQTSLMDAETIVPLVASVLDADKKRFLSSSSMSSNYTASSPRLRKKRGITANEECLDDVHSAEWTVFSDHGFRGVSAVDPGQFVNSDFAHEDKNEGRFGDYMSNSLSETGSFGEDEECNPVEDSSQSPKLTRKTQPTTLPLTQLRSTELQSARVPTTSPSSNQDTQKIPVFSPESGQEWLGPQSPVRLSGTEVDTTTSPSSLRPTSSSSLRQEARSKFFNNYEQHISQTSQPHGSIAEEDSNFPSESHPQSPDRSSSAPSPSAASLLTAPSRSVAELKDITGGKSLSPSQANTSNLTQTKAIEEGRGDHLPKIMRSGESRSRRSERRNSASKHESTSSRSGFSRSSKKRELTASSDTGSRTSLGYASYVSRVVAEIVESERTYIASLEDIIHGYMEPMDKMLNSQEAKKDIECLFSNIKEIYKFGCTFLADLETAETDCVKVAQCFVRHNMGFVIYTDYCTNYPRAVEVLTRFMQHPELSELCKDRQLALGHGLPLGAYLLKPVQRILKYHLLLHNIVKNCEKEKKEAVILEQAFHHMTKMAHHINEMKRKHEHAVRIQEIQSQLEDYVGEDLTRLGELVLEGTFKVYGAKASRQVFLFERGVLISKKTEEGMLSCKTFIPCYNLMLVEVIPNEPLSFHIIPFNNPRAQYTLQARNMEQKKRWCQDIKQLILESFKGRIPDNVKNLIMQLGREHDDDYVSKEALEAGRKNQHTAPEYLEKRRFRGKSGPRIPDFSLLIPQIAKRGGHKKSDVRSRPDVSPEPTQRAKSKSPNRHHQITSKQNVAAKGRSQSSNPSPMPGSGSSKPKFELNHAIIQAVSKTVWYSSATTSPDSPVYKKSPNFTFANNEAEETDLSEKRPVVIKRPKSFMMARENPVLSSDLTQLLARCGGSIKIQSPPTLKDHKDATKMLPNLNDISESINKTDMEVSLDDTQCCALQDKNYEKGRKSKKTAAGLRGRDIAQTRKSSKETPAKQEIEFSTLSSSDTNVKESKAEAKSTSSLDLNNSVKHEDESEGCEEENNNTVNVGCNIGSEIVENMDENVNISMVGEQSSKIDMCNADQSFIKQGATADSNGLEMVTPEKLIKAFHEMYSKNPTENAMKNRSLRLPNTSKHLLAQEYDTLSDGDSAKLIDWSSVEKFTKGSINDLSYLDEDPWVRNSDVTSSNVSKDKASPRSFRLSMPTLTRPQEHSDVTEMMQVSNNKQNMDWIVSLNRNSPPSLNNQSTMHEMRSSSPILNKNSTTQDNFDTESKFPSQISHDTPPTKYMTSENMKILGSLRDSSKDGSFHQDDSVRTSSNFTSKKVNAFGASPMTITVAKPIDLTSSGLFRSNSISLSDIIAAKYVSKDRPVSLNMDRFHDDDNRIVNEIKEYNSNSTEIIQNTNRLPAIHPAIRVDEIADSNRMSVVSSISTLSNESQSSSSSDGLVGTLKSKLHSWTKLPRSRNDSEVSCASTLTSDDEDRDVLSKSGNTFEPSTKNRSSWKEDRQLEIVLREHSLGSSKLGSRMAHSVQQPAEQVVHHSSDSPAHESHPQSTRDLASVEESEKLTSEESNFPAEVQLSLPPTTKASETHMLPALKNGDVQQSESGFSLLNDESNVSDSTSPRQETAVETALKFSDESFKEDTLNVKTKMGETKTTRDSSNLDRSSSLASLESINSYNERKLSAAFDSVVFRDKSEMDKPYEPKEAPLPISSIRKYVKNIEEKHKTQSPKIFEVKRKETGSMIRQRLQTLRESALYGWRSTSINASKHPSDEKSSVISYPNKKTFTGRKDNPCDTSNKSTYLERSKSRDSLSKSIENLSRSQDNVFLSQSRDNVFQPKSRDSQNLVSRSRESLNSLSKSRDSLNSVYRSRDNLNSVYRSRDSLTSVSRSRNSLNSPGYRHSAPIYSLKPNNPGHEKDANRFHYMTLDQSQNTLRNQFIHRTQSGSQHSLSESEVQPSMTEADSSIRPSKLAYQLNDPGSEVDNLVVMKGWVKSLISKFQVQS